ncbi:MAG TPA: lactonase family protein [Ferruginibacter sp.]|nr:lactonase family protein [Ferruginibacter sp.]HMP20471.1 lactonase family protein [Ferruginibacter sp.]
MKQLLPLTLLLQTLSITAQKPVHLIAGTYTGGKSEGIYVYQFNPKNGKSKLLGSTTISNPSFIAVSPDKNYVYAVTEDANSNNNGGGVAAFRFDKKNGKLQPLNQTLSRGNHPCYVACDATGKWLFAGNYSSGNFSVFPLLQDGSIGTVQQTIQHRGSGPNTERQEAPHVHGLFLNAANTRLYVPDLGIDKVMLYHFDAVSGALTTAQPPHIPLPGGSGPRHLSIHPSGKYVYVAAELTAAVAVFALTEKNDYKFLQTISAVPENYTGSLSAADIHVSPDGKYLYASCRGEANSIAIYTINPYTGVLAIAGHQPALGIKPRNFNFDPSGNFLLVANQDSNSIVVFKIDHSTGLLTDTGNRIEIPNPACIQWID